MVEGKFGVGPSPEVDYQPQDQDPTTYGESEERRHEAGQKRREFAFSIRSFKEYLSTFLMGGKKVEDVRIIDSAPITHPDAQEVLRINREYQEALKKISQIQDPIKRKCALDELSNISKNNKAPGINVAA